jgi:hypothetical protein
MPKYELKTTQHKELKKIRIVGWVGSVGGPLICLIWGLTDYEYFWEIYIYVIVVLVILVPLMSVGVYYIYKSKAEQGN